MKIVYQMPIVLHFGDAAVDAKTRRLDPNVLRNTVVDAGTSKRNQLLILPAFIAVIVMVIMFLGISWSIRAGLELLSKVISVLSVLGHRNRASQPRRY